MIKVISKNNELAECPIYSLKDNVLYWVDILKFKVFSYDFKTKNKEWFPEEKNLLKRKRSRNAVIFILYINVFLIFLTFNSFIAHLLDAIINIEKFSYPI